LSKKNKAGGIVTYDFKIYLRAIESKTAWYNETTEFQKNEPTLLQSTDSQEGDKNIHWKKDSL
jgi:ADP-glucose pyrophosphorylase